MSRVSGSASSQPRGDYLNPQNIQLKFIWACLSACPATRPLAPPNWPVTFYRPLNVPAMFPTLLRRAAHASPFPLARGGAIPMLQEAAINEKDIVTKCPSFSSAPSAPDPSSPSDPYLCSLSASCRPQGHRVGPRATCPRGTRPWYVPITQTSSSRAGWQEGRAGLMGGRRRRRNPTD